MTALLDLRPDLGHPAVVVAGIHELLDSVDDVSAGGDHAETVVACERAIRRLEALKLRLVARAETRRAAQESGHATTSAWLAARTKSGSARCAREVRLAEALDAALPATADALAAGALSPAHANVIAEATSRLPRDLSAEKVAAVERRLVDKGRTLDPPQLRRAARRALEAVEPDTAVVDAHEDQQLHDEESAALSRTRLTWHDNGDGTLSGHFTVPTLAGSVLQRVIQSMTAPRRARPGATRAQAGDRRRDWSHEAGLALVELIEHLPTDRLHRKTAATVVVTLDLATLHDRLHAAGLDTGDLVSAAQARRLACSAGIVPAVLGGQSQPLDLGRSRRLFTEAQRVALGLHHTTCAADGCERPYAWCELHHRRPWSRGGRTDLADAVPLCGFHHRRIHDPDYDHRERPGGAVTFHRRT